MNTRPRHTARRWAMTVFAAIAIPLSSITFAQSAVAVGDVCDLCSINFDPTACDASGFAPYDSTVTDRYGNPLGGSVAPVPAAPAPAAPAPAPAPAAPAPAPAAPVTAPPASKPGKQAAAQTPAVPAAPSAPAPATASVPASPAAPTLAASGASLVITWGAPADGGAPITGYRVALNGGAGVDVAADESSYTFEKLTAGEYSATVLASNAVGVSPVSPASSAATITDAVDAKTVASTTAAVAETQAPSSLLSGALILVALVAVAGLALLGNFIRTSGGIAAARERFTRSRRTTTD